MKDFLGNELQVGDAVVYCRHAKTNAHLLVGKVAKIHEKKVTILIGIPDRRRKADVYPEKLVKYTMEDKNV